MFLSLCVCLSVRPSVYLSAQENSKSCSQILMKFLQCDYRYSLQYSARKNFIKTCNGWHVVLFHVLAEIVSLDAN